MTARHEIESYLEEQAGLETLRFITCGSVDDGKSTLIGRMLYESQMILDDQLSELQQTSAKSGTQGDDIDFALLVDGLSAEREQGITIDVAYRYFATEQRKFIVADTPGHEQYTRNMVTGASTADLAVVLVDARKGILEQTRRHTFIASLLGIRHIVLAVNKMDLVEFDQDVFQKIVADYDELCQRFSFESVTAIPLSALEGDNVVSRSTNTAWYQDRPCLGFLVRSTFPRQSSTMVSACRCNGSTALIWIFAASPGRLRLGRLQSVTRCVFSHLVKQQK